MTLPEETPERLIADAFTREVPEVAVGTVILKLALAPVHVVSCELDSAARRAVVRVRADDLGRTLGPRGVHRNLVSRLVGWDLILEGVDAA